MPVLSIRNLLIAAISATVLAACGSGDDKKPATQIAARVNKEEISVHQINAVLARAGSLAPEQARQAGRQILDKLVDQELLVQQALEGKLDREPRIMQAIEAGRRDILARAYLDKVASAQPKPAAEEIRDFYAGHPELFSARRIYQFQELAIPPGQPDFLGKLQERMKNARSLADVANWLRSEKIPFNANAGTKAAEQLPLELLPKFHQMKDGQIAVIPARDSVMVVQLAASRDMPMDEKAATPFIEQFLGNRMRMEAAEKEVKQLREKAKIEYQGDFAAAKAEEKPAATPAAKPVAATPAPAAPAQAQAGGATHMDKGIAGLK
jgi:EpsD family peptidyl-prolyl cis-trans isomerase